MFRLNTFSSTSAGGSYPTQLFENFLKGNLCRSIRLRFFYPYTVTGSAFTVPSSASGYSAFILNLINAAVGSLTLTYGESKTDETVYNSCNGADMRLVHRIVYGRELICSAAPGASIGVGSGTITLELDIAFEAPILSESDCRINLPGWSQMRSMQLVMVEGAAFTQTAGGVMARNAGAQLNCDLLALTIDAQGEVDQWAPVLRLNKKTTSFLETDLADGSHLAIYETTQPFASTAITLFSLRSERGDDKVELAKDTPIYLPDDVLVTDYLPVGASNPDDSATFLYTGLGGSQFRQLLSGRPFVTFPQAPYSTPTTLRQLFWPTISQDKVDKATLVAAKAHGAGITSSRDASAANLPSQVAAATAFHLHPAGTPGFTSAPGTTVQGEGKPPVSNVPGHFKQGIANAGAAGATTGVETGQATSAEAQKRLANIMPGMTTSVAGRHKTSSISPNVAQAFRARGVNLAAAA